MDNYTGPYISDGKIQSSVEFGATVPISDLDRASRLHDSAYAHYKKNDRRHLTAADAIYNDEVRRLGRIGKVAAGTVLYGNYTARSAAEIAEDVAAGEKLAGLPGALGGLIVGGVTNALFNVDWMLHGKEYVRDVITYYGTDPYTGQTGYYDVAPSIKLVDRVGNNFPGGSVEDEWSVQPATTFTPQTLYGGLARKQQRKRAAVTHQVRVVTRRRRKSTKFLHHAQN